DNPEKYQRFVEKVLAIDNNYDDEKDIRADLQLWTKTIKHYNQLNHSELAYGYARLDAFGRIYNRVLQHVINRDQLALALMDVMDTNDKPLLEVAQVKLITADLNETVVGDIGFAKVLDRLQKTELGYP